MPASNDSSPNFDFLNGGSSEEAADGWTPPSDSAVGMVDAPQSEDSEDKQPAGEEDAAEEQPDSPAQAYSIESETVVANDETTVPQSTPDEPAEAPSTDAAPETSPSFEPPAEDDAPQFDAFAAADAAPDFSAMSDEASTDSESSPATDDTTTAGDAAEAAIAPALAVTQVSNSARPKRSKSKSSSSSRTRSSSSKKSDAGFALAGPLAIGLISYAVLATVLLVYMLMYNDQHQLESLPDRPPLSADEFRFVPETAAVAPGHELRLGDAVRFGNILVEPVRVTRDQAELEHYAKKQGLTPPPAGEDVLKLWLKLTNVSTDQKIAPFDRKLVYDRRFDGDFVAHSDQYVVPATERGTDAPNVDMYDISPDGEWDLKGQSFPVLNPGESVTTYLAAGPDELERLTGPAVWRMLMRKGYNDQSGNGVLTLIDVVFDASQAVSES